MNCRSRIPTVLSRSFASHGKRKSHYDNLEIDSKATQGEIKSAYFKLSMQYHPDKNPSDEAKVKFRDISEAYEVLGNYEKRRQYDRGMQIRGNIDYRRPEVYKPQDIKKEAFRARSAIYRHASDTTGTSRMYDFDAWTKEHYGWTFQRSQAMKEKVKQRQEEKEEVTEGELKYGTEVSVVTVAILAMFGAFAIMTLGPTLDTPAVNYAVKAKKEESDGGT